MVAQHWPSSGLQQCVRWEFLAQLPMNLLVRLERPWLAWLDLGSTEFERESGYTCGLLCSEIIHQRLPY